AASKATRLAAMPAGGKTPAADVTVNIYARKFFNPAANRCFCLPRRPRRHGKGRSPGKCSEAANHITARKGDVGVCHDGAFIPPRGIGQVVISSGWCFYGAIYSSCPAHKAGVERPPLQVPGNGIKRE